MTTKLAGRGRPSSCRSTWATTAARATRSNPTGLARRRTCGSGCCSATRWLDILGQFMHLETSEEHRPDQRQDARSRTTLLFPRFHQWEAVTALVEAVARGGSGAAVPDPALGRLGQDELDRLDRAPAGARCTIDEQARSSTRSSSSPTATCSTRSCRRRSGRSTATTGVVATIDRDEAAQGGRSRSPGCWPRR